MLFHILSVFTCFFAVVFCCDKGQLLGRTMTAEDRNAVIHDHNNYRSMVALGLVSNQPKARNMIEMKWDNELATKAQNWADRCIFQHDRAAERKVARFPVGQNLAVYYTSNDRGSQANFSAAIQGWFKEHNNYNYKTVQRSDFENLNKQTGHYTQVAWATSYLVGCGYSYYLENGWYTKLYVCNYGPSGNFIGQYPYEKGSPDCSAIKKQPSKIKGLCV